MIKTHTSVQIPRLPKRSSLLSRTALLLLLAAGATLIPSSRGAQPQLTFTSTGNLSTGRAYHTETLLLDGRVLVTGGSNGLQTYSSAEIYDPATRTWSYTGSMSTRRLRHSAAMLPDGQVLISGGLNSSASVALATAEVYDPATGVFTLLGA